MNWVDQDGGIHALLRPSGQRVAVILHKGLAERTTRHVWEWKITFKQGEAGSLDEAKQAVWDALSAREEKVGRIAEWPLPEIRIRCEQCNHEVLVDRDGLAAVFGEDADMFSLRMELTQACSKKEACTAIYTDALLVQAMLQPDPIKVLEPKLLPLAREKRRELGIEINDVTDKAQEAA